MLYPQYLDYTDGTVGAMAEPPRLVHFHGAVTTYRVYRDRQGRSVGDDLFRLLLLSILEELVPDEGGERILPPPETLAQGLTDPSAPVTYASPAAAREYPVFRREVDDLCQAPTFAGERAARVAAYLRPFDEHFAARPTDATASEESLAVNPRRHGLS